MSSSLIDIKTDNKNKLTNNLLTISLNISTKNSSKIRKSQFIQMPSKINLPSIFSRNNRKTIFKSESPISKFFNRYNKNKKKSVILKSQSLNDILIPESKKNEFNSQRIYINNNIKRISSIFTGKSKLLDKIKLNFFDGINKDNKNINKSEVKSNIIEKGKEGSFINKDFDNKNNLNSMNNNITSNIYSDNQYSNSSVTISQNNKIIGTNSTDTSLKTNKYRRIRIFNLSKINEKKEENEKNEIKQFFFYENNIKFQSKIFDEQIKLFNSYYKEYKYITNDINYMDVFKSKSLAHKIRFNKSIEKACCLLYALPPKFLKNCYNLMQNIINIKIPDLKKYDEEYIYDENDALQKNNNILTEVVNYFNKNVELYMILSTKDNNNINNIFLSKSNFLEVMHMIKNARYNIIYLINSYNNSKKKYEEDLILINKFLIGNKISKNRYRNSKTDFISNNNDITNEEFKQKLFGNFVLESEKNKTINAIEKIENQFIFKKDEFKERKKKIESALDIDTKKPIYNYLGKEVKINKKMYKSIFFNKHLDKIFNYCYDDIKNKIIKGQIDDDDDTLFISKKSKKNKYKKNFNNSVN